MIDNDDATASLMTDLVNTMSDLFREGVKSSFKGKSLTDQQKLETCDLLTVTDSVIEEMVDSVIAEVREMRQEAAAAEQPINVANRRGVGDVGERIAGVLLGVIVLIDLVAPGRLDVKHGPPRPL